MSNAKPSDILSLNRLDENFNATIDIIGGGPTHTNLLYLLIHDPCSNTIWLPKNEC